MISPTEADVGRRVIYDVGDILPRTHGVLVGFDGRHPQILFDGHEGPLTVISNLRWVDE